MKVRSKRSDAHTPMGKIVTTLEELRIQAAELENEDAQMILDVAFKLCLSIYFYQLRGEYPPLQKK
jgi:hypothetical protein